jgi:uncharacterized protein (TIGR02246 family)
MSDARAGIDRSNQDFMAKFARQDAEGLASLYTVDACLLPSQSDIIEGTDNIKAFWRRIFDMGVREGVLETVDLEALGDTAIEMGRYTMKVDGGAVADHGKYVVVWKNDGKRWKLHKDIFNTSQPAS